MIASACLLHHALYALIQIAQIDANRLHPKKVLHCTFNDHQNVWCIFVNKGYRHYHGNNQNIPWHWCLYLQASNLKVRSKALQASRRSYYFGTNAVTWVWLLEESVRWALDAYSCVFEPIKLSVWKPKQYSRWSNSGRLVKALYSDAHSALHTLKLAATLQAWRTTRWWKKWECALPCRNQFHLCVVGLWS